MQVESFKASASVLSSGLSPKDAFDAMASLQELASFANTLASDLGALQGKNALASAIDAVVNVARIPKDAILSKSRCQPLPFYRHVAYALGREFSGKTHREVGEFFGVKHTNIAHGIRIVRDRASYGSQQEKLAIKLCRAAMRKKFPPIFDVWRIGLLPADFFNDPAEQPKHPGKDEEDDVPVGPEPGQDANRPDFGPAEAA